MNEGVHTLANNQGGFEIRVLGPVEALINGQSVALGGPRQRAVLALLLLQPARVVSTDALVDALWTGEPPDGAATTIRSYVSKLRTALGEAAPIRGTSAGYAIDVSPETIDAAVFDRLIRTADDGLIRGDVRVAADSLARALAMWRGRPFGDLSSDGPLRVEADRLEELRLHGIEQRLEANLLLGRAPLLVDELETAVANHPYRERLWRLLMLALYHSGRQADALAAYQRARKMLDEQLGLDPSAELQELEAQILRQEVPVVPQQVSHDNLPSPLTSFVGRAAELSELDHLVRNNRMVTLTGVGGVGKTRLAIELARRGRETAPDGVLFVDLAPIGSDDAVVPEVARVLELREQVALQPIELVVNQLRHARMLVVLDNCEHVLAAAGELADALRRRCPDVRVLATSRIPLGSYGEIDYPVEPLRVPPESASPEELRNSDAVRLLFERSAASQTRRASDEALMSDAARICRDLDGLPLAIELAAARAKAMSLGEIAGRLDDRFRFLVSWRRVAVARHQTLKQAIDWSYDLLSATDRLFLSRLAVFAGGFTLEAAAAICVDDDEVLAVDAVTRLVDASLIIAEHRDAGTRYRLLETIRQYADSRLADAGDANAPRDAHADFFRALAEQAEPELSGAHQTKWFTRLDDEHSNFVAALNHLAATGRDQDLLEFTVALTRFWYVRGHLAEARRALERALDAAETAPPLLRRRALTAAASIALLQGDYTQATGFAQTSLEVARESGDARLIANGLSNLGAIVLAAGEYDRAGLLLAEAVDRARSVGDTRILALALNNQGDHALTIGDYGRAEPLFEESLSLLRERGDTANVARSLFNLGGVALKTRRLDEAEERLRQSLSASGEAGDKEDLCWGLLGLAALAADRAEAERAATLLGAATAVLAVMGADFKPFERQLHAETERKVIELLGKEPFEAARIRGGALSLTDAVEVAIQA